MCPLRQLRASADQRVHYAVVPHHVRHLPACTHRAEDLGLGVLRGFGGVVPGRPRHLGEAGRVSGPSLTQRISSFCAFNIKFDHFHKYLQFKSGEKTKFGL